MRWPDDEDEVDDLEPEDNDSDDEDVTVPCPHCRRAIVEDIAICPYCENFLSREDNPVSSRPRWVLWTAILCLLMALMWVVQIF
jgi:predicted nucleic acid-binding Zn ribbon protein